PHVRPSPGSGTLPHLVIFSRGELMRPVLARETLFALVLSAVAAAAAPGCGAPRVYRPDTTLVTRLGHDEATARVRTLLGRAESPTAFDVDVTREHIDVVWLDTRQVSRWRFRHIESIDIRSSDHVVTLRLDNTQYVYRIDFTTGADATAFVDLIASFHRAGH